MKVCAALVVHFDQKKTVLGDTCSRLVYTKQAVGSLNINIYYRKSTFFGPDGSSGQLATRRASRQLPGVLSKDSSARRSQSGMLSRESSAKSPQPGFLSQESSAGSLQPICLGSALESFSSKPIQMAAQKRKHSKNLRDSTASKQISC